MDRDVVGRIPHLWTFVNSIIHSFLYVPQDIEGKDLV